MYRFLEITLAVTSLYALARLAIHALRIERGSRPYDDTASFSRVRDDGCEISGVRRVHDVDSRGAA